MVFRGTALRILVSNDDGIHAAGLWALAKELSELGTVTIVAPDRDQSGVGTSVTLRHPLRLLEVNSLVEGVRAYLVEGTPADSVILALKLALKDMPDLVVSGINEGPNLGDDVFISGTVGAALQGYFYGIPSIAVSVAAFRDINFDVAARLVRFLTEEVREKKAPARLLLNINVPNLSQENIEGIEVTSLGRREYSDNVEPGHDGKRNYYWVSRGVSEWHMIPGTDTWALKQNRISITTLPNDAGGSAYSFIKGLVPDLYRKLLGESLEEPIKGLK